MDSKKGTLSLSLPPKAMQNGEAGKIRQSFSHGKSKVVAVEVKKRRFGGSAGGANGADNSPLSKLQKTGLTSDEVEKRLSVVKQAIKDNKVQAERKAAEEAEAKKAREKEELLRKQEEERLAKEKKEKEEQAKLAAEKAEKRQFFLDIQSDP